jgi:hypothetical protein
MADCIEYEILEQDFIDVRTRNQLESMDAFRNGMEEAEHRKLIGRQTREEVAALRALLNHAAEHGCQRPKQV